MTVELKEVRKVAVITWSTEIVHGAEVSIEVEGQEKRTGLKNDGESNLFFPDNYSGSCEVSVKGSHAGEDTGTIHV